MAQWEVVIAMVGEKLHEFSEWILGVVAVLVAAGAVGGVSSLIMLAEVRADVASRNGDHEKVIALEVQLSQLAKDVHETKQETREMRKESRQDVERILKALERMQ